MDNKKMQKLQKAVGMRVFVKGKWSAENIWAGEWGIVKGFDGEYFHVAMYDGKEQPIFTLSELFVWKNHKKVSLRTVLNSMQG